MTLPSDPTRFEPAYLDDRVVHGLPAATPWDIGGPQPAIRQLVALGAVKGEVLDVGTGPGHHAIYFAAQGYSSTGIDASPAALERAARNAERAGVSVNFELADATTLDGFDARFDTVVDCAFYHLLGDEQAQRDYLLALHRATRPCARLFMFEFAPHNVNGLRIPPAVPEQNFRRLLPQTGWEITYLGTTTAQINVSVEAFEEMTARNPDLADQVGPMLERLRVMAPWLDDGRAHVPYWEVHASRHHSGASGSPGHAAM